MANVADTAEGSGESDIVTWLKENKLASLVDNQKFMKQEVTIEDLRELTSDEIKYVLCQQNTF